MLYRFHYFKIFYIIFQDATLNLNYSRQYKRAQNLP